MSPGLGIQSALHISILLVYTQKKKKITISDWIQENIHNYLMDKVGDIPALGPCFLGKEGWKVYRRCGIRK